MGSETEMADKVDALAILDDVIADMGDLPGTQGHELAKARSAVAELVKAARNFCSGMPIQYADNAKVVGNCNAREVENMRAALANVRGAA